MFKLCKCPDLLARATAAEPLFGPVERHDSGIVCALVRSSTRRHPYFRGRFMCTQQRSHPPPRSNIEYNSRASRRHNRRTRSACVIAVRRRKVKSLTQLRRQTPQTPIRFSARSGAIYVFRFLITTAACGTMRAIVARNVFAERRTGVRAIKRVGNGCPMGGTGLGTNVWHVRRAVANQMLMVARITFHCRDKSGDRIISFCAAQLRPFSQFRTHANGTSTQRAAPLFAHTHTLCGSH